MSAGTSISRGFTTWLRSWRPLGRAKSPDTPPGIPPLYHRKPPLWAQWTYALVACDIFMTATAVELTWNHWTEPIGDDPSQKASNLPKEPTTGTGSTPSNNSHTTPTRFALRPVWQRLGLCVLHLGIGVGAAVALVGSYTRVIRTICILPRQFAYKSQSLQEDTRQIFIQCAHHWRNRGRIFPISSCRLYPGRDDSEMILRVDGERGHWWIGLNKAKINGRDSSLIASRVAISREWKQQGNTGWKSGPILSQKTS